MHFLSLQYALLRKKCLKQFSELKLTRLSFAENSCTVHTDNRLNNIKVSTFKTIFDYFTLSSQPIENRIYIREEFKESLGVNFFSVFKPEREFKVYKSCKCSQIICSKLH